MQQVTNSSMIPGRSSRVLPLLALLLLPGCETLGSLNPWSGRAADLRTREQNLAATRTPEELYNNGVDALNQRRLATAVAQFDAVEQNYPYSSWAVNAQLMRGYAEYLQNRYTESIGTLDRFIQLHPGHRDIAYAYYLRALNHYEQIADIQRDQKGTELALGALQEVVNRFPDSAYARDARLKIDLCRDHLAGKEMEIGRWYQGQKLYPAAINRFQRVIDDFQTTNHTPEALHRLTEIYLTLGLVDQARRTAAVLGHNYPGSEWYEDSYATLAANGEVPAVGRSRAESGFFSRTFGSLF